MKLKMIALSMVVASAVSCSNITSSTSSYDSSSSSTSSEISSESSIDPTSSSIESSEEEYIITDLVKNGDFTYNVDYWGTYDGGGTLNLNAENSYLNMSVKSGWNIWEPRLDQMNMNFKKDQAYMVEYRARTNIDSKKIQIQAGELLDHDPWFTSFGLYAQVNITKDWQVFSHIFVCNQDNDRGGLIFEVGNLNNSVNEYDIYLDDVVIYEYYGDINEDGPTFDDVSGDPIVTSVPKIYLTTNDGQPVNSKFDYVGGKFSLVDDKYSFYNISNLKMNIRGRGNSTWWMMPKKPYRVKFDTQVNLFNMGANKDWVFLANYADKSLIRNYLVYNFASSLSNLQYSPGAVIVELYLNNSYEGVYLLTSQIETGTNRINIEKSITPSDTAVPFLLEWDRRLTNPNENEGAQLDVNYFVVDGIPLGTKYPETFSTLTSTQYNYIKTYMQNAHNAMINRSNYSTYIDINSFVDFFLLNELFKNVDVGYSSVYMYKGVNDKLKMGPVWDFDLAIGNADYIDYSPYNWYGNAPDKNIWFYSLMQDPVFYNKFKARFNEIKNNEIQDMIDSIEVVGRDINEAADRNFEKWVILGKYDWPNPYELVMANTFEKQVYFLRDYLEARVEWLDNELN